MSEPTVEVLRQASDHVWYEWRMLTGTAELLLGGRYGAGSVERNALLESFAVHARALRQFLACKRESERDVVACDYFEERAVWHRVRGPLTALDAVDRRVGREIAHLSYDRLDVGPEAKGWPVADIAAKLDQLMVTFAQTVSSGKVSDRWLTDLSKKPEWTPQTAAFTVSTTSASVASITPTRAYRAAVPPREQRDD